MPRRRPSSRLAMPAAAAAVAASLLAGCGGSDDRLEREAAGTTTTAPSTTSSTTTTSLPVTVAGPQPASATCPAVPPQRMPDPARPRYDLDIDVRPGEGLVTGQMSVRFEPDLPTDRLVFRLWPNGPRPAEGGAHLDTGPLSVSGGRAAAVERPDPTTLVAVLDPPLDAGEAMEVSLPWELRLPGAIDDRVSLAGGAVRLGSFFPVLAWEPGVGWATDPATSAFAEASTVPVADFAYRVTVPEGFSVLASGTPAGDGRWQASAMRDIALTVGRFSTAAGEARAPQPVAVTVGVHEGVGEDPAVYLDRVIRSLQDMAALYGPYPYATLSLSITPHLRGGIEYPGHIMQGPGTVGRTTPHEVAHQWFYALVGNNQGRDPWLDEGLATWAEARFEGTLGAMAERAIPAAARNRLGAPMSYWESRQRSYYRGVYVQGAQALAAVAAPEVVDCGLRHYAAANAFSIATPDDLIAAMEVASPGAGEVLSRFGAAG